MGNSLVLLARCPLGVGSKQAAFQFPRANIHRTDESGRVGSIMEHLLCWRDRRIFGLQSTAATGTSFLFDEPVRKTIVPLPLKGHTGRRKRPLMSSVRLDGGLDCEKEGTRLER